MNVSARVDYAVRAAVELAAAGPNRAPVKREAIAEAQSIPIQYLVQVLINLRNAGLVLSRRGHEGGYRLSKPADQITVADIVSAIDGKVTTVRGEVLSEAGFPGATKPLHLVWAAVDAAMRSTLGAITLADVAANRLPSAMTTPTTAPSGARPPLTTAELPD